MFADDYAGDAMSPIDNTSDSECYRCKCGAVKKRPPWRSLFERLLMMIGWTDLHIKRRRSRLALLRLTDEQLKDIGLSRCQIDGGIHRRTAIDRLDPWQELRQ